MCLTSLRSAGVGIVGIRSAGVGIAGVKSAGVGIAGIRNAGIGIAGVRSAGVGPLASLLVKKCALDYCVRSSSAKQRCVATIQLFT